MINEIQFIYCLKCGTKLPADSDFCIKCGSSVNKSTLDEPTKKVKSFKIRNIILNKKVIIVILIVSAILGIVGFKTGKKNYWKIENRKEIVRLSQELLDLTESSSFLTGEAGYREDLKEAKADLKKVQMIVYGGYTLMTISIISFLYFGYRIMIIYNMNKEKI